MEEVKMSLGFSLREQRQSFEEMEKEKLSPMKELKPKQMSKLSLDKDIFKKENQTPVSFVGYLISKVRRKSKGILSN